MGVVLQKYCTVVRLIPKHRIVNTFLLLSTNFNHCYEVRTAKRSDRVKDTISVLNCCLYIGYKFINPVTTVPGSDFITMVIRSTL
jgi:hypothetical protein